MYFSHFFVARYYIARLCYVCPPVCLLSVHHYPTLYQNSLTWSPPSCRRWTAASWVKKVSGTGDTVNFWHNSDGKLQISDRGDYWCLSRISQFWTKNFQTKRSSYNFLMAHNFGSVSCPYRPCHCLDSVQFYAREQSVVVALGLPQNFYKSSRGSLYVTFVAIYYNMSTVL